MHAMRFMTCLATVAAAACDPDPALPSPCQDEFDLSARYVTSPDPAEGNPCPTDGCGGNSPVIEGVPFERLHLLGQANPQSIKIVKVVKVVDGSETPMQLQLVDESGQPAGDGDRLRGVMTTASGGVLILEHIRLIDTRITVSVDTVAGPKMYEIRIAGVMPTDGTRFWVRDQRAIETYDFRSRLAFDEDPQHERPLCANLDGDPTKIHALVFGGDLYDPVTKEITAGTTTHGWINIACADSALYKMHRIGHTSAAQRRLQGFGIATDIPQRRAMLNAWTANVCGDGTSFTVQGEPIKLAESGGWLPLNSEYLDPLDELETESIEAIWGPNGAICLNTPRRLDKEPGICTDVANKCKPDPCTKEQIDNWTKIGHVLTGNPFPLPSP